MAIDQNAMYRAGLARGTTGRNPQVERQIARKERLVNIAYDVVGTVANEAIKDGFESMQRFRDLKDSQTAAMNLTAKKVPEGNTQLNEDINTLYDKARKAAKKARWSFGKKKAQYKAEMRGAFDEMQYINEQLTAYQASVPTSQGTISVATGVAGENNKGGNSNISPAAYGEQVKNIAEQANGDLGQLMWYEHENKVMRVTRGGKWVEDGGGKRSYISLGIENNKELKKKYKKYEDESSGEGVDDKNILSYPDWAQTQNRETLRNPKYSEMKFPKPEDKTMTNDHLAAKKLFSKLGYSDKTWVTKEIDKAETFSKIDAYSEGAFKDFFFGGPGFNHSNRTLTEGSLAYKMLISRNLDDDPDNDVIPPGSDNSTEESDLRWQGALTTLKMQDMRSGSQYRKFAQEELWTELEGEEQKARTQWGVDNPKTGALSFDQKLKLEKHNLDLAKYNKGVQKGIDEERETQNTVYSIENEFSAGETTIGTGSRYVQKSEAIPADPTVEGSEPIPASWTFFANGKVEKTMPIGKEDILDEITKHVTDTAGKYGTFKIGLSEKEITKDGVTTTYVYAGYGKWSLKK